MPKKEKMDDIDVVDPVEEAPTKDSEAKKAFAAHIEAYKEQNPAKYEAKKEELEAKLASL